MMLITTDGEAEFGEADAEIALPHDEQRRQAQEIEMGQRVSHRDQ